MVDGHQPVGMQAFHLHAVVHNIAKTIERATVGKLFLSLLYGSGHAKAETAAVVYFYLKHNGLVIGGQHSHQSSPSRCPGRW